MCFKRAQAFYAGTKNNSNKEPFELKLTKASMRVIYTSTEERIRLAQRTLCELQNIMLPINGIIEAKTLIALREFQRKEKLKVSSILDDATWAIISRYAEKRFLTERFIVVSAWKIGILPSVLFAIRAVQGRSTGFLPDKRALVFFEKHKFYFFVKARLGKTTANLWAKKYPDVCSPYWSKSSYKDPLGEWDRVTQARMLDATCALLSTSWGMFQIMGFNYALCGYRNVQDFVASMLSSEKKQFDALLQFIKHQRGFYDALKRRDFEMIALIFNGPHYFEYNIHKKLEEFERTSRTFNI